MVATEWVCTTWGPQMDLAACLRGNFLSEAQLVSSNNSSQSLNRVDWVNLLNRPDRVPLLILSDNPEFLHTECKILLMTRPTRTTDQMPVPTPPPPCLLEWDKCPLECKVTPTPRSCMANTIKWDTPLTLVCSMVTARVNNLEFKVDLGIIK